MTEAKAAAKITSEVDLDEDTTSAQENVIAIATTSTSETVGTVIVIVTATEIADAVQHPARLPSRGETRRPSA